jgi:hypothetical protein
MRLFLNSIALACALSLLLACRAAKPIVTNAETGPQLPATLLLANYPLSQTDRPTTAASTYLAHIQGRLQIADQQLQSGSQSPAQALAHAGLLYQRYQILGSMADLDQAFARAKALAAAPEPSDDALLLWATLAAYMHEFPHAERALAQIKAPNSPAKLQLLAQMQTARGQTEHAPINAAELSVGREFAELVHRAGQCVDKGDLDCATQNYHQAQFVYSDSAPFPLAWLHTQQGIALLRFGYPEWALRFFDAALARMPGYYLAAEHRAECLGLTGKLEQARTTYLEVIEQTGGAAAGNPEFMAALASVEAQLGNVEQAGQWRSHASAGFASRLAQYPNAYAQHAVDFYMEINDLEEAERLAEKNLTLRQDVGSYLIRAEVALAKKDKLQFCAAYQSAIDTGFMPPELTALTATAKKYACGR